MALASAAVAGAAKDPILLDYLRRRAATYTPLLAPEDVIGEQLATSVGLAAQAVNGTGPALDYPADPSRTNSTPRQRRALAGLAGALAKATPYLWLTDVRLRAVSMPVPRHIFSSQTVPESMWWTMDVDTTIKGEDGVLGIGVLVIKHALGVEFIEIVKVSGWPASRGAIHIPDGFRYPDDCPNAHYEHTVAGFLGMLSFLNSPYIPQTTRRIAGRLRRTYSREGAENSALDRDVRFIDLRSPEVADPPVGPSDDDDGPSYRHRWIVRGHHRAQWYPSLSAHKVIWIAPYVKGPDGAPMIVSAYRVRR